MKTEVVLRLSSNIIGDNETNFPHELLLTNRQVASVHKSLQIICQLILSYQKPNYQRWYNQEDFFGRLHGPLLKIGLPLIKNVIKPLAKSVLITLRLTAAASAADAGDAAAVNLKKNLGIRS